LDYKDVIENFSVKATVWQSKEKPRIDDKPSDELVFDQQGNNFMANFSRKDYRASRSLAFSLPVPKDIPQVQLQAASGSYYFVASCLPDTKVRSRQWSKHLGIIWDVSLSGLQRDIEKELALLDALFREQKDLSVSLYMLNNRFSYGETFKIVNGEWDKLRKTLESATYDGGTDYSAINLVNATAKEFLFFSDGLSTLSDADFLVLPFTKRSGLKPDLRPANPPIHCIVSSAKADYSTLKWIAAQSNGKFINLNALSDAAIKKELTSESLHFLGVEKPNSVREVYPSIATPVNGNFSIAGILDASQADITLLFGYGNQVETRVKVTLQAKGAAQTGNVYRIWAQKKINELDLRYEKNKDELTELGQQFGIVTRNTSLIVLETVQDYINYDIAPPTELHDEYARWRQSRDEDRTRNRQTLLAVAINAAETMKQWWTTDFTPVKPRYPKPVPLPQPLVPNEPALKDEPALAESAYSDVKSKTVQGEMEMEVSPLSNGADNVANKNALTKSQPVIRLTQIRQDNAYNKALTGKADADYAIYLKLRPDYVNTPNFYFDMASWFFGLNDREKALRILTSVTEIEIENASLYRLIAYRLKEYKEYPLEKYICQKLIQWRPMEPQSYRDYALALADADNNQEAFDALYGVLTRSYANSILNRSPRIEEVLVTELNQMMVANNRLDVSAVDKRLIQAMPVDIRVVLNWNKRNNIIDLHVKDPNGEMCSYNHATTALGGRISYHTIHDYGPEEFLLKKAVKGRYEIFTNYYSDSQVKDEGPTTLMLEIYTKYSDKSQKREVMCLQLSKENQSMGTDKLLKVGEFEF
jgi:tetratricopeptide (TPR) repeat protein